MDPEYDKYFAQRLDEYQRVPAGFSFQGARPRELDEAAGQLTREALEQASRFALERTSGRGLRSDGQLFLYLIGSELIVRPILNLRRESIGAVQEMLAHDSALIVGRAAEGVGGEDRISAHRLIDATSESWSELSLAQFAIWDGV